MRVQGWDPVLIICQIISLQSIHYLTLSFLLPPLLSNLTSPSLLSYSGGPQTVSHILDWRELASRPSVISPGISGWGAWAGGKHIGSVPVPDPGPGPGSGEGQREYEEVWDFGVDERRGWLIGISWLTASAIDIVPLYYLVRRPTYILDFSLTLTFIHLILTSYYANSFPTSLFFWVVQAMGALLMIVVAEQLCVKREMRTDLDIGWDPNLESGETMELADR